MSHTVNHQITLRGLPKELVRELKGEAKKQKMSLNQVLLKRLSHDEEPKSKKEGVCTDLLKYAGSWDEARTLDFEKAVQPQRKIDPELWR